MSKLTKKETFEATLKVLDSLTAVQRGGLNVPEMKVVIQNCITQLEDKAEKAKARAVKEKAKPDEKLATVYAAVTDEFKSGESIWLELGGEEFLTRAQVTTKLSKLVKTGEVIKMVKTIEKRRLMCYGLPAEEGYLVEGEE